MHDFLSLDHIFLLAYFALIFWAALGDAAHFRIPNTATFGLILLYPAHALTSAMPIDWLWAIAVAAAIFALSTFLFSRGFMGGGDVKLLTGSALWAGPELIAPLVVLMALAGGVLAFGAYLLQQHRRYRVAGSPGLFPPVDPDAPPARVPYGVAIAVGAAYVGARLVSG